MKLKKTIEVNDYKQFVEELRKDKKQLFKMIKGSIIPYSMYCLLFSSIVNFILYENEDYLLVLPEFLVINIILFGIFYYFAVKSDLFLLLFQCLIQNADIFIKENKYILRVIEPGLIYDCFYGIENYYETENYIAIPCFSSTGVYALDLLRKDENEFWEIKKVLDNMTEVFSEKIEKRSNILFVFLKIGFVVSLCAYLSSVGLFLDRPFSRTNELPFAVSRVNTISVSTDSKYYDLGLRSDDIILLVNDEFVLYESPQLVEEKLKAKNVKLKVLKFETGEIKEYILNEE